MDFNGDGIADILSGCYWSNDNDKPGGNPQAGYFMILAGLGDMDFEEAKPITNAEGEPLLNVPLTKEQEENYDSNNIQWGNLCTSQHAVDYDGDGDLDLVTGCMGSLFYAIINSAESPDQPPKFDSPGQELAISSPRQHSDPHLYDWDGDGDLDLLTGGDSGGVYISMNEGSLGDPQWADFKELVHGHSRWEQSPADGEEPLPGHGARVWVTDFNHDGKPDLLGGDCTSIKKRVAGISDKEFERRKSEYDKEMEPVQKKMSEIRTRYRDQAEEVSENREELEKLMEKMQKELAPFSSKLRELKEKQREFSKTSMTGHVWVYLQQ